MCTNMGDEDCNSFWGANRKWVMVGVEVDQVNTYNYASKLCREARVLDFLIRIWCFVGRCITVPDKSWQLPNKDGGNLNVDVGLRRSGVVCCKT